MVKKVQKHEVVHSQPQSRDIRHRYKWPRFCHHSMFGHVVCFRHVGLIVTGNFVKSINCHVLFVIVCLVTQYAFVTLGKQSQINPQIFLLTQTRQFWLTCNKNFNVSTKISGKIIPYCSQITENITIILKILISFHNPRNPDICMKILFLLLGEHPDCNLPYVPINFRYLSLQLFKNMKEG